MTDERNDLLRTFKAFSCANAALQNHPEGDNRSEADIEEADALIAWLTSQRRQDEIDEKDAAQAARLSALQTAAEKDGEMIRQLQDALWKSDPWQHIDDDNSGFMCIHCGEIYDPRKYNPAVLWRTDHKSDCIWLKAGLTVEEIGRNAATAPVEREMPNNPRNTALQLLQEIYDEGEGGKLRGSINEFLVRNK